MKKRLRNIFHRVYFNLILRRKLKKTVVERVGDFRFNVYPSVFNPKDYFASEIFADFISALDLADKKVLDMGCGSGVLSVFALSKGAVITSADINPVSVKCTEENIKLNGFAGNFEVIESNLFEKIAGKKFNIIFFNPPYYKGEPENDFEKGFYGGINLEIIDTFFINAKEFLLKGGAAYLILSDDADLDLVKLIVNKEGYKITTELIKKKFYETFYIYKMF